MSIRADGRQPVLFIAGAGRSGSTLIERVVGRLPDVTPLGEVRYLWDRGVLDDQSCGCGLPFGQCPYWTEVGGRAFGGWDPAAARRMQAFRDENDRARHIPALLVRRDGGDWITQVAEHAAAYAAVYRAAAAVAGTRWVIDSSKHVSLPYILARSDDVDLAVLHVVRDPRGVAYSWSKEVVRPEITDRLEYMPRYSVAQVARTWLVHNGAVGPVRRRGVRLLRVRYEDFVASPDRVLSDVARFLAVQLPAELSAQLATGEVELPADHTVAGNPLRFRTGRLTLRGDQVWVRELAPNDRRMITALTSPMMLQYGYPLRRQSS